MNAENQVKTGAAEPVQAPAAAQKRRGARTALMISVPLALALAGGYFWLTGGRYVETQDANVHQARVQIAAPVSGLVTAVEASNNEVVKAGDVLFRVDPRPFQLALAQADAGLAKARLEVQQLKAAYAAAVTQEKVAADQASYLDTQLAREVALGAKGVASNTAVDDARHASLMAHEQLDTAKQNVLSAKAALVGNPDIAIDRHPTVLAALAARDKAQFDLAQTTYRAPGAGIVYQAASFKPGQYVTAGATLFSLVETGDAWVEADFKETQLPNVKVGQPATVSFDLYPGHIYHGTVSAIGAGTGAEFSLIPPENATGNWVKVTQRIPVYIKLSDAGNIALRSGMSADVSVDTGHVRQLGNLMP